LLERWSGLRCALGLDELGERGAEPLGEEFEGLFGGGWDAEFGDCVLSAAAFGGEGDCGWALGGCPPGDCPLGGCPLGGCPLSDFEFFGCRSGGGVRSPSLEPPASLTCGDEPPGGEFLGLVLWLEGCVESCGEFDGGRSEALGFWELDDWELDDWELDDCGLDDCGLAGDLPGELPPGAEFVPLWPGELLGEFCDGDCGCAGRSPDLA
jgi:hypothetical protein